MFVISASLRSEVSEHLRRVGPDSGSLVGTKSRLGPRLDEGWTKLEPPFSKMVDVAMSNRLFIPLWLLALSLLLLRRPDLLILVVDQPPRKEHPEGRARRKSQSFLDTLCLFLLCPGNPLSLVHIPRGKTCVSPCTLSRITGEE